MAGKKEQIVLLVEPGKRARLDALRIVVGDSRARVAEMALDIDALEAAHARGLNRVGRLAKAAGVSVDDYATAYAKAFERRPYGATLDELEISDAMVRAHLDR